MFHSREVKEQLQQAENLRVQAQQYEQTFQSVSSDTAEAQMDVDQIQMSAAKMDRSLTKVVDYARDTKEDQQMMEQGLQDTIERMRQDGLYIQQLQQAYESDLDFLEAQKTALMELMEQSKHYTGLSKAVAEGVDRERSDVKRMSGQLSSLQQFTGTISSIALQAAIDAGRMGEDGSAFVQSAEQIRSLAEVFGEQAQEIVLVAADLQDEITEIHQQVHQFISLLKDNNRMLSRLTADATEWNQKKKPEPWDVTLTGEIEELQEFRDTVSEDLSYQEGILEEMERIGNCYMEQQESAAHMEQIIAHMKGSLTATENEQRDNSDKE